MVWLKKEILFILSAVLLTFTSCNSVQNKSENEEVETISKEELVDLFFNQIQNWSDQSVDLIDSLGYQIEQNDSLLTFLPYLNDYEENSFIFTAKDKNAFQVFEESSFLSQSVVSQQSSYKVWRKNLNEFQILDLSIEPHPTLDWLFVIRLRSQE